jgi:hypothetical protein
MEIRDLKKCVWPVWPLFPDGARLPISRTGYARLLEAMGDSQGNRNTTL